MEFDENEIIFFDIILGIKQLSEKTHKTNIEIIEEIKKELEINEY